MKPAPVPLAALAAVASVACVGVVALAACTGGVSARAGGDAGDAGTTVSLGGPCVEATCAAFAKTAADYRPSLSTAIPADFPPAAPSSAVCGDSPAQRTVFFTSTGSVDEIAAYYDEQLLVAGYERTVKSGVQPCSKELDFTRGSRTGAIYVLPGGFAIHVSGS